MTTTFRRCAFTFSVVGTLLGCQSKQVDRSMIVEPENEVSFSRDVQPIFDGSCGGPGCHLNGPTSGVRLSSHASIIASRGLQYGDLIIMPFDADASAIVDKINPEPDFGLRMPFGRPPLSEDQIGLISKWINEGAEDN